jgi:hypothetical protein
VAASIAQLAKGMGQSSVIVAMALVISQSTAGSAEDQARFTVANAGTAMAPGRRLSSARSVMAMERLNVFTATGMPQ